MDISSSMSVNENTSLGVDDYESASEAMKKASFDVINTPKVSTGIHKVTIITRLSKYDRLRKAMNDLGVTGMTVTQVMGVGIQKGACENTGVLKWMLHCFLKYRLMWQ